MLCYCLFPGGKTSFAAFLILKLQSMKKPLLFVAASLILTATTQAAPAGATKGDIVNVPLQTGNEEQPVQRPRVPALVPFSAVVDADLCIVFVSSVYDAGEITAVLENYSTGERGLYTFDASDTAVLPFSGDSGFWRITLTLEDGADYVGEFEL